MFKKDCYVNIAICDDTKTDIENLQKIIEHYKNIRKINLNVDTFNSGKELISSVNTGHEYDLIFLDIIMPVIDGISLGKKIREQGLKNQIIYTTTTKDFAFDAFSVDAMNYLLKPVTEKDVFEIIDKKRTDNTSKYILLESQNNIFRIDLKQIKFCEARGNYVYWYLMSNKIITIRETLQNTNGHL